MPIPALLHGRLSLPVIAAPLFIVSAPALVIAACKAGVVGSFPALNARPKEQLEEWIVQIKGELAAAASANPGSPIAPVRGQSDRPPHQQRLEHDVEVCIRHQVPITITSLSPPGEVVKAVHAYGGIVLHDVISVRHAEKALEQGVDGLILVCAGAGGHAGTLSPFALLSEVRRFWNGPIVLSGAITNGRAIAAAQALGADLAVYRNALHRHARSRCRRCLQADDPRCQGQGCHLHALLLGRLRQLPAGQCHGGGLRSRQPAGSAEEQDRRARSPAAAASEARAWRDVWSAGQGVGQHRRYSQVAECVARLDSEYREAAGSVRRASASIVVRSRAWRFRSRPPPF